MRLKYALRSLAASPSFTLGSILCLSIGLACTIAAFSMINAALFRSMPGIVDQQSLRNVWTGKAIQYPAGIANVIVSVPEEAYAAYRSALADVAELLAFTSVEVAVQYDAAPMAARAVYVSPNYFGVLGTRAAAGRMPHPAEPDAAVVSDRFWRTHMGARPDAVGQTVHVNGRAFHVTAIAPAKFVGAARGEFEDEASRMPAVWLPFSSLEPARAQTEEAGLRLVARLRPETSERELEARAGATARGLAAADPARYHGAFVRLGPLHRGPHEDPADTAIAVGVVMIIPVGILLIGCANLANLLLARGTARAREVAVKLALGASRRRIVGELLLESMVLSLAASVVAVTLCAVLIRFAEQTIPFPIALDWRVAIFAIAAAAATAVLFGLMPALSSSRTAMTLHMADARRVRPTTRRALVVAQLAVSTTLIVITALLTRSVVNVTASRGDVDEARVAAMSYDLKLAQYDRARSEAFARDILEVARALPGVEAAGIGSDGLFRPREYVFVREPGTGGGGQRPGPAGAISEGWLQAAGVTLLAGRDFTRQERRGPPTAVLVDEALARRYWPNASPLGRTLLAGDPYVKGAAQFTVEVVGVVSSGLNSPAGRDARPRAYLPSAISLAATETLWIRTRSNADDLLPILRSLAAQRAPELPITHLETAAGARRRESTPYRLVAQGMAMAGALALGLAALGLFSLLTYLVVQRRREVGIRMALGARPRDIVRLIAGESAWVAAGGAILGSALAVPAAIGLRDLFVGVGVADPLSLVVVAVVLIVTALVASAQPAFRASRTDPSEVLRAE